MMEDKTYLVILVSALGHESEHKFNAASRELAARSALVKYPYHHVKSVEEFMKRCTRCGEVKSKADFYKWKLGNDGLQTNCKPCSKEMNINSRNTLRGLVSTMYLAQKERSVIKGFEPPAYTKEELKDWITSRDNFESLFNNWVESGYKKMMKPSCDRLDDYKGYYFDNLRLVTWSENLEKGSRDRISGANNKVNKRVVQLTKDGDQVVAEYHSIKAAARSLGNVGIASCIGECCKGKRKTTYGFKWRYADE